jgi:hypothetical protein
MKLTTFNFTTCHRWHTATELADSCDNVHAHYTITWPVVLSSVLATVWHLVLCFLYVCSLPILAVPETCIVLHIMLFVGQNPHSLEELHVVHPASIVFPQVWTVHWNFLKAADHSSGSLNGFCTFFQTESYVSKLRTVHLHHVNFHSVTWFP